jgi:hypothetical protein
MAADYSLGTVPVDRLSHRFNRPTRCRNPFAVRGETAWLFRPIFRRR